MADSYEQARDQFIAVMVQLGTMFGFQQTPARIYGLLAFVGKPMSLDEIAEILHLAKSGVSTNIRMVEQLGFIQKVWVKGDRKDYYTSDIRYADLMYRFMRDMGSVELTVFFGTLNKCKATLAEGEINGDNVDCAVDVNRRIDAVLSIEGDLTELFNEFVAKLKIIRDKEEKMINE